MCPPAYEKNNTAKSTPNEKEKITSSYSKLLFVAALKKMELIFFVLTS